MISIFSLCVWSSSRGKKLACNGRGVAIKKAEVPCSTCSGLSYSNTRKNQFSLYIFYTLECPKETRIIAGQDFSGRYSMEQQIGALESAESGVNLLLSYYCQEKHGGDNKQGIREFSWRQTLHARAISETVRRT
ncbi:hypothetical protein Peur_064236 [Populus x canadensis]